MKNKENDMGFKSFICSFAYLILFIFVFFVGPLNRYGYVMFLIASLITIIAFCILKVAEDNRYKESLKQTKEYDYFRDVNFKYVSPVEAGKLLGVEKIGINTFIVILFELEKKEILNIEYVDEKFLVSLKNTNLEDINNLVYYEKSIVKMLFSGTNDKTKLELGKIIEMIKENAECKVFLDSIYKNIDNNINDKYYINYVRHMMDNSDRYLLNLVAFNNLIMNAFVGFMYLCALLPVLNVLAIPIVILFITQIILTIYGLNVKYLKNCYVDEVRKLNGLYNYINDFSNINEKEIKYYELYQEYFLYAISMGIADRYEIELGYDKLGNDIKANVKFLFECKKEYL